MSNEIENDTDKKLPKDIWYRVCIFSAAVGCLFGVIYRWPGLLVAGLGGLYAGYLWCWVMSKFYAAMKIRPGWLAVIGIALGVMVGIADGILLNCVVVYLVRERYMHGGDIILPWSYKVGFIRGLIFGAGGGYINGLIWGAVTAGLYKKNRAKNER